MRMGSRKVSDGLEIAKKESAVKFTANLLAALALSLFAVLSWAQEKAVYHFDGGVEQATRACATSTIISKSTPRRGSLRWPTPMASIS